MHINDQIAELNALRLRAPLRFLAYKSVTLILFCTVLAPFLVVLGAFAGIFAGAFMGLAVAGYGFMMALAILNGAAKRRSLEDKSDIKLRAELPRSAETGGGE